MSKYDPYRDALLQQIATRGVVDQGFALAVGGPWKGLSNHWHQVLKHTPDGQRALNEYQQSLHRNALVAQKPAIQDILDLPPKVFPTRVPKVAGKRKGKWLTALLYGDSHYPYQDDRAVGVIQAIAEDEQPNVLMHMGDGMDCYRLSRFNKNPARLHTIQDEIDAYRTHLEQMAQLCPDAERYVMEGNHEARMEKVLWALPRDVEQLTNLRKVKEVLRWPVLLDLATIGFTWVPYREQSRTPILPKFVTKHGNVVRKWAGYTARSEWEKYGKSGASGHCHRGGKFIHRDHNGNQVWIETYCTCDLSPEYGTDFDWQQGCWLIHFNTDTGGWHFEDYYIQDGNAMGPRREYQVS
jgi:predicted phosphodiesterase